MLDSALKKTAVPGCGRRCAKRQRRCRRPRASRCSILGREYFFKISGAGFCLVQLAIGLLGAAAPAGGAVVTDADSEAVSSAISEGGVVRLEFSGTVRLTNTLTVAKDTTLDASGQIVILDGGNAVRHFVVTNGAALRLVNLTLVNGRAMGRDRQANEPGGVGQGGSILNGGDADEGAVVRQPRDKCGGHRGVSGNGSARGRQAGG